MAKPRISREEYLRRRGDRTRRLAPNLEYQVVPTAIVASKGIEQSTIGQVVILIAANLLGRWARRIYIGVQNASLSEDLKRQGFTELHERIKYEVGQANPYCDLRFDSPGINTLVLRVGLGADIDGREAHYAVAVDGWDAVGWRPGRDPKPFANNIFAPFIPAGQLAASLGVAQLFKLAVRQPENQLLGRFRWCLWNHRCGDHMKYEEIELPQVPNAGLGLGSILQAGVGAVGSNVLYFLTMTGSVFDPTLIDYDGVEVENLDRTLLFGIDDVGLPKVKAARRILTEFGITSGSTFGKKWNGFVSQQLKARRFDVWLALANEEGAWQSMAENLPPLVLHGTTSDDWGVSLGRHIPLVEYCLRCRFPPEGQPHFLCSKGEVELHSEQTGETERIHASLPFLSAATAALVVGELLKLELPGYRNEANYVEANLWGAMEDVLSLRRASKPRCSVCGRQSRAMWRRWNGATRYAFLSNE